MLVLRKFREEDEEEFIKVMFKVVVSHDGEDESGDVGDEGNCCC